MGFVVFSEHFCRPIRQPALDVRGSFENYDIVVHTGSGTATVARNGVVKEKILSMQLLYQQDIHQLMSDVEGAMMQDSNVVPHPVDTSHILIAKYFFQHRYFTELKTFTRTSSYKDITRSILIRALIYCSLSPDSTPLEGAYLRPHCLTFFVAFTFGIVVITTQLRLFHCKFVLFEFVSLGRKVSFHHQFRLV